MIGDLSTILMREIPPALVRGVQSGELAVHGSVIRSLASGKIVAHLQETSGLASLAGKLLPPGGFPLQVSQAATSMIGDGLILEQGRRIKAAVDFVSQMQLANLILSGATLGVSVAGFAILSAKVQRLEAQLSAMDQTLADLRATIESMREDKISDDFAWLRTALQQLDESWALRNAGSQLQKVATDAHLLANRFFDHARALLALQSPKLEQAGPFLEAFGLAQQTRVAARLAQGEDEAARVAVVEGLVQHEQLLDLVNPTWDALSKTDKDLAGSEQWDRRFMAHLDLGRTIAMGARVRAESLAATDELLASLSERQISGRDWLATAREERGTPILVLPVDQLQGV